MRKRRLRIGRFLLLFLLLGGIGLAFRQGLVPARYSPLPALDLENPTALLIDWQLAELRHDAELCSRVLVPPHIEAVPIGDNPLRKGCGWTNSVRVSSLGGARLPVDKLSCQTAAALALWMAHEVQPLAESELFTKRNSPWFACKKSIGAAFDDERIHATVEGDAVSGDLAAPAIG